MAYFVALAREGHFGRAAASCFVSQSSLSEAIQKLEIELDVPLVRRGRSFEGLTPEGEQLLVWVRRIVADQDALHSVMKSLQTGLVGTLRLGVIPSATQSAADLVDRFCSDHPLARVNLQDGLTSDEIVERLRRFELDAGIVHTRPGHSGELTITPLYAERQRVLMSTRAAGSRRTIRAVELSELPLCLLAPGLHARQSLDAALERQGIALRPQAEVDSVGALVAMVARGRWAGVTPQPPRDSHSLPPGVASLELVDPSVSAPVVLAIRGGEPFSPFARAVIQTARAGFSRPSG
ncbi:LysR family transcriptional regulator [Agromyces sp. Soil535]|uniref:LysR family transcriptional regulator n=1 Tax=Agromyces sp. Soil535 TaxID=1736390 RepID=UPI0019106C0D|nr:LysR family transcriptional regulator [Agromyces sp. Soil535]